MSFIKRKEKEFAFGIIVGNRDVFPDRLAKEGREEIIKVIKASKDVDTARKSLMTKFKLSEVQASHILDMPLRRLTALEMEKLEEEKKELKENAKKL